MTRSARVPSQLQYLVMVDRLSLLSGLPDFVGPSGDCIVITVHMCECIDIIITLSKGNGLKKLPFSNRGYALCDFEIWLGEFVSRDRAKAR